MIPTLAEARQLEPHLLNEELPYLVFWLARLTVLHKPQPMFSGFRSRDAAESFLANLLYRQHRHSTYENLLVSGVTANFT